MLEKDRLNDIFYLRMERTIMDRYRKLPREEKRDIGEEIRKLLHKRLTQ